MMTVVLARDRWAQRVVRYGREDAPAPHVLRARADGGRRRVETRAEGIGELPKRTRRKTQAHAERDDLADALQALLAGSRSKPVVAGETALLGAKHRARRYHAFAPKI